VFYAAKEVQMAKEWFSIGAGEGQVESVFALWTLLEKESQEDRLKQWVSEEMIEMMKNTVRKRPKAKKTEVKTTETEKA
jgi:hypothetical protein